jgi:hypothetical protein
VGVAACKSGAAVRVGAGELSKSRKPTTMTTMIDKVKPKLRLMFKEVFIAILHSKTKVES